MIIKHRARKGHGEESTLWALVLFFLTRHWSNGSSATLVGQDFLLYVCIAGGGAGAPELSFTFLSAFILEQDPWLWGVTSSRGAALSKLPKIFGFDVGDAFIIAQLNLGVVPGWHCHPAALITTGTGTGTDAGTLRTLVTGIIGATRDPTNT